MPAVVSTRGTIPLTPFLEGRGNSKKSWGTPPDPCQRGCTPLDSPLSSAGAHPPCRLPVGLHPSGLPACGGFASIVGCTIPLPPSWKEGGIVRSPGGHPQTPAKGVGGTSSIPPGLPWGTSSIPPASGVAPSGLPACHPGVSASPQGASRGDRPLWQEVWRVSLQSFTNLPPSYQEGG